MAHVRAVQMLRAAVLGPIDYYTWRACRPWLCAGRSAADPRGLPGLHEASRGGAPHWLRGGGLFTGQSSWPRPHHSATSRCAGTALCGSWPTSPPQRHAGGGVWVRGDGDRLGYGPGRSVSRRHPAAWRIVSSHDVDHPDAQIVSGAPNADPAVLVSYRTAQWTRGRTSGQRTHRHHEDATVGRVIACWLVSSACVGAARQGWNHQLCRIELLHFGLSRNHLF